MPTSKDFIHIRALFNLFRNVMNYSNVWKIDWSDNISETLPWKLCKQGAHIHQPTYAHSHITREVGEPDSSLAFIEVHQHELGKPAYYRGELQSTHLSASSTQHMWELLAGNRTAVLPRHARQRRIMGCCMCAPCFKFAFWKWWIKLFYCINNLKSRLYIADFSKYWRSCFCPKLSKFHFP